MVLSSDRPQRTCFHRSAVFLPSKIRERECWFKRRVHRPAGPVFNDQIRIGGECLSCLVTPERGSVQLCSQQAGLHLMRVDQPGQCKLRLMSRNMVNLQ